jgi:hypothetical protein
VIDDHVEKNRPVKTMAQQKRRKILELGPQVRAQIPGKFRGSQSTGETGAVSD